MSDPNKKFIYFVEIGEQKYCGIKYAGAKFFTADFDQRKIMLHLEKKLNANPIYSESGLTPILAQYLSEELNEAKVVDQALDRVIDLYTATLEAQHPITAKILSVNIMDYIGDFETPENVAEWKWIEKNASMSHLKNGEHGIWEFLLNLCITFENIPEKIRPLFAQAKKSDIQYLLFHQGT